MDASLPATAAQRPSFLVPHRRVALFRPGRIDLRPSPAALAGPLLGVLVGLASFALIAIFRDSLPLVVLAALLALAVLFLPLSAMGVVYGLYGTNVIFD